MFVDVKPVNDQPVAPDLVFKPLWSQGCWIDALAKAVIAQYPDAAAADKAEGEFFAKMKGGLPDDIPEQVISAAELEDGCARC